VTSAPERDIYVLNELVGTSAGTDWVIACLSPESVLLALSALKHAEWRARWYTRTGGPGPGNPLVLAPLDNSEWDVADGLVARTELELMGAFSGTELLAKLDIIISKLDSIGASTSVSAVVCCEDVPPIFDPPDDPIIRDDGDPPVVPDWPEYYIEFCKISRSAVQNTYDAMTSILDIFIASGTLEAGWLVTLLSIVFTPYFALLQVILTILQITEVISAETVLQPIVDKREELVCALTEANTVAEAKVNLDQVVDDSGLLFGLDYVYKQMWTIAHINRIFNLDPVIILHPEEDLPCDCFAPGEGCVVDWISSDVVAGTVNVSFLTDKQIEGPPDAVTSKVQFDGPVEFSRYEIILDMGEEFGVPAEDATLTIRGRSNSLTATDNLMAQNAQIQVSTGVGGPWATISSGPNLVHHLLYNSDKLFPVPIAAHPFRYLRLECEPIVDGFNPPPIGQKAHIDSVCYSL
jgi:hypothetical protein